MKNPQIEMDISSVAFKITELTIQYGLTPQEVMKTFTEALTLVYSSGLFRKETPENENKKVTN